MRHIFNRKGYIFTDKKVPVQGIFSVALGAISDFSVFLSVYLTCMNGGNAPFQYGMVIMLSFVYSAVGIIAGVKGLMQKDIFRFFPVLGIILNGLSFLADIFILYIGVVK